MSTAQISLARARFGAENLAARYEALYEALYERPGSSLAIAA